MKTDIYQWMLDVIYAIDEFNLCFKEQYPNEKLVFDWDAHFIMDNLRFEDEK